MITGDLCVLIYIQSLFFLFFFYVVVCDFRTYINKINGASIATVRRCKASMDSLFAMYAISISVALFFVSYLDSHQLFFLVLNLMFLSYLFF